MPMSACAQVTADLRGIRRMEESPAVRAEWGDLGGAERAGCPLLSRPAGARQVRTRSGACRPTGRLVNDGGVVEFPRFEVEPC